jgi:ribonucleoside-diphosphate reductase alpha chain
MGFADALFKLGVGYNTTEGVAWGEKFMKFVNDEAHNESERLAEERGVFKNWKGSRWETEWKRKQRNACSTTVAPTGTISIIAGCSGGIEPLFSLAFFRQVMRDHTGKAQHMTEVNDVFKAVAKANNCWGYSEHELFDRIATEGTLHNIPNIPEDVKRVFVCAHDISPEWHVHMQAGFQKHCDSSISKTTNFPNTATPDDVRAIYNLAYDTRCKGVTVYRDGCRKGQPMALKENAEKKPEAKPAAPAAPQGHVALKPVKTATILSAVRIRSNTPFGHMHLTISVDPKTERELEVFAQLGKAGDVAASDLEAICRMVSLFLRSGGTLDLVMDQLEGIGSHLSIPTKDGRVMSLGDALGKTIHKYWQAKKNFGLKAILLGEVDIDALHGHTNGNGHGNGHSNGHANGGATESAKSPSASAIIGEAVAHAIAKPKASAKSTYSDEMLSNYKLKCPECGSGTLAFVEGCVKCAACGYSKC